MGDKNEDLSEDIVQPLKNGRDVITALFISEDQSKLYHHEQKRYLEQVVMARSGPDPLDPWLQYIQWVEQNHSQGGKEGDLLQVCQDCLEAMEGSVNYKADGRLLEVHLQYLDLTERDLEYFNRLYSTGYFHNLAVFYISWADAAETANDFVEGDRIYQLGKCNKAEPANILEEGYKHYQARVAKGNKSINCMPPEKSEDERNVLRELESKTVLRSGAPNSTPSTDIPFVLADLMVEMKDMEAEAEAELFRHRQTAGEEEDQARHNCAPLLPGEVDVTVPLLVNAFARNLHFQKTSMPTGNRPSILVGDSATLRLPKEEIQPTVPEDIEPLSASAPVATPRIGLSAIAESFREYDSIYGSSAGPTGLASQLSVGSSLPSVRRRTPASVTPPPFHPFESVHRRHRQLRENTQEWSPLYDACESGDMGQVGYHVMVADRDVDAKKCHYGSLKTVPGQSGIQIEVSPLFIACLKKHAEIVKFLVKRGANVTADGLSSSSNLVSGLTPLHAAFFSSSSLRHKSQEQLEIIRCLVGKGANPSAALPNDHFENFGSLIDSKFWCNPRALHLLVEHGMSVTQRCPLRRTILHHLAGPVLVDDEEVFTVLLEKGADLNARDNEGITPILAVAIGDNKLPHIPILKLLLDRVDVINMDKIRALELGAALLICNVNCNSFPLGENIEFADRVTEIVHFLSVAKTLRLQEGCPLTEDKEEKIEWVVESFTSVDDFQQLRERFSELFIQSILIRLRILSSISWGAFRRYLWQYIDDHFHRFRLMGPVLEIEKTFVVCRKVLKIIRLQDKEEKGVYATTINVVEIILRTLAQLLRSNDPIFSPEIPESTLDLLMQTYQAFPPTSDDNYLSSSYFYKFYRLIVMLNELPDALNTPKVQDFVLRIVGLNGRDSNGRSFLYHAIRESSCSKVLGVVELLVQSGIDADAADYAGNGALHYLAQMKRNCIQREAAARLLLDHGAHLDRANSEGKTAADIWQEKKESGWFYFSEDGFGASGWKIDRRPEWLNEGVPQLKCLAARAARRLDLHVRVLNKDGLPKLPPTLVRFVGMHRR